MKRPTVGNKYWATDYSEMVEVVAIEREGRRNTDEYSVCLVRRANGVTTSNYPAYLLLKTQPYDTALTAAERQREYVARYRAKNREWLNEKERESRAANRDKRRESARQNWIEHRESLLAYHAEWRAKNSGKVSTAKAKHKAAHGEAINARARERHAENPDRRRAQSRKLYRHKREAILARRLFKLYGLTLEQWNAMLLDQGMACAACLAIFQAHPHVDHDHVTGVVRGLLCFGCNAAIGQAKESAERLRALADYLDASAPRKAETA